MKALPWKIGTALSMIVLLFASILPVPGNAADGLAAERKRFLQDVQQTNAGFTRYKEKQDQEFAAFLKKQWREFEIFKGTVQFKKPMPRRAPIVSTTAITKPVTAKNSQELSPAEEIVIEPPAAEPPLAPSQPQPIAVSIDTLELPYFGNTLRFTCDPQWIQYRLTSGDTRELMSGFWAMMSSSNYAPIIESVDRVRRDMQLDDWGRVMLWRTIVRAVQPERLSEQNLLLWFFLVSPAMTFISAMLEPTRICSWR
jgi:hypothetical protein